jgi:hypothetical protein
MKYRYILLSLSILLYAACQKNGNVTPVVKPTIDSIKKADSVIQIPVTFIPHTDTFYGKVYEDDGTLPLNIGDSDGSYTVGQYYVYAYYNSQQMVTFSSNYNNAVEYRYMGSFTGTFQLDSINYYSSNSPSYNFKIVNDNLFYNGYQMYGPDEYTIYFSGKKKL